MKRIKSACLLQTIHFQLKEEIGHDAAVEQVRLEVKAYKERLDRSRIKYRITDEQGQPDGSILLHIRKQYNGHSCDEYM